MNLRHFCAHINCQEWLHLSNDQKSSNMDLTLVFLVCEEFLHFLNDPIARGTPHIFLDKCHNAGEWWGLWAIDGLIFQKEKLRLSDDNRFPGPRATVCSSVPHHILPCHSPLCHQHELVIAQISEVTWSVRWVGKGHGECGVRKTGKKVRSYHTLDVTQDGGSGDGEKRMNLRKRMQLCTHKPLFLLA